MPLLDCTKRGAKINLINKSSRTKWEFADAVDCDSTLNVDGAATLATGATVTTGGLTVTAGSTDIATNGTDDCDFVSGNGAKCTLKVKTASITITAVDTNHEEASWIPAGSMVIGFASRVTTTITGASANISVGYTGQTTVWCNAKASKLAAGTTIDSFVDGAATAPIVFNAATDLIITSSSGNFTGGVMRCTIWYYDLTAPTS